MRHAAVEPAWGVGLAGPSSSTSSSSSPNPSPNPSPSSRPSPRPNPRPHPGQARHAAVEPDRALAACCGRSHDHGLPHGPGQPARQRLWPVAGWHKLAAATATCVMPMPGAGRPCAMPSRGHGRAGCRLGTAVARTRRPSSTPKMLRSNDGPPISTTQAHGRTRVAASARVSAALASSTRLRASSGSCTSRRRSCRSCMQSGTNVRGPCWRTPLCEGTLHSSKKP